MRNAFWNKTIQQCGSRHHRRAGWEKLVEDIIWETVRWYQQSKESVSEYKHSYVKKCLTFVSEHQQKQDCRTFSKKGKFLHNWRPFCADRHWPGWLGKCTRVVLPSCLGIRRHKAEEVLLDTTIFLSQTCRSWRPEVCLFDHESLQVVAYWGMGLRRQSKYIYGMVLRVKTAKALWQCLEALDNGPPLCLDTSLWKLLLLPFDFLTCSHVFHILRAKILETFQFQTVAQLWARRQEWQQTSFTTMWTKICYKTYLSHLGRSNTCSTASTSLSSFTSLALT